MVIERANDSLYKNAQGTKKIIPFSIFQELQYESNLYLKKRGEEVCPESFKEQ